MKVWIAVGAVSGFLAVACGAFGAHGLQDKLDPRSLSIWETAARYQMYHALALVLVGVAAEKLQARSAGFAAWAFAVGTVIFSGSLYALALSGIRILGAITPIGGLALMAGWLSLAWAALR